MREEPGLGSVENATLVNFNNRIPRCWGMREQQWVETVREAAELMQVGGNVQVLESNLRDPTEEVFSVWSS